MPIAIGDRLRSTTSYLPQTGGITQNVLHWRATEAFANAVQAAENIHSAFIQRCAIQCNARGTFINTSLRNLDQPGEPPAIFAHNWGPGPGEPMPANLTVKVFLIPAGFGPRHYGKMFINGALLSWSSDGLVNSLGINSVQNFLGSIQPLFVTATPYGLRWSLRVNRRSPGLTTSDIIGWNISNRWARIGSRKPGIGI